MIFITHSVVLHCQLVKFILYLNKMIIKCFRYGNKFVALLIHIYTLRIESYSLPEYIITLSKVRPFML